MGLFKRSPKPPADVWRFEKVWRFRTYGGLRLTTYGVPVNVRLMGRMALYKKTTIWLPDNLRFRLSAESARADASISKLIRRGIDLTVPPGGAAGDLAKFIDKTLMVELTILDAQGDYLEVEFAGSRLWLRGEGFVSHGPDN